MSHEIGFLIGRRHAAAREEAGEREGVGLLAGSVLALLSYQQALRGLRLRIIAALLSIVRTVVIVDILDLASARPGNFRTTTAAYEWTIQGFQGGAPTRAIPTR